jgi:hypothetical protein
MGKFTLSFEYDGQPYTAAIGVRETPEGRAFLLTPLNKEQAKLLSSNPFIREINGILEADVLPEQGEQTRLKLVIASRLSEYLNMPCFAGNVCLMAHAHVENWEELHPLLRHVAHRSSSEY